MSAKLRYGQPVRIIDSRGEIIQRRALSPVEPGDSFPVIWTCAEREWQAAKTAKRKPDGTPWPAHDLRGSADA